MQRTFRVLAFRTWYDGKLHYNIHPAIDGTLAFKTDENDEQQSYAFDEDSPIDQFTGLLDQNEQRIFEHDLISNGQHVFVVGYNTQCAGFWRYPVAARGQTLDLVTDFMQTSELTIDHQPEASLIASPSRLGRGYLKLRDIKIVGNIYESRSLAGSYAYTS